MTPSFDIDRFIAACQGAVAAPDGERAIRELVAETVSDPSAVALAFGEPEHAGLRTLIAPPRPRSEWDHETLVERPWDLDDTRRSFADAEARSRAWRGGASSG